MPTSARAPRSSGSRCGPPGHPPAEFVGAEPDFLGQMDSAELVSAGVRGAGLRDAGLRGYATPERGADSRRRALACSRRRRGTPGRFASGRRFSRALCQQAAQAGAAYFDATFANKVFCTSWPMFRLVVAAQADVSTCLSSSGGPLTLTATQLTQLRWT